MIWGDWDFSPPVLAGQEILFVKPRLKTFGFQTAI
jgi:hypothetical protein